MHHARSLLRSTPALALALIASAGPLVADDKIVNGLETFDFPSVGALLYGEGGSTINPNNAISACTATLIGCSTVLTAAHCVEDDPAARRYQVYFQHAGLYSVESIAMHPGYRYPTADIAILRLAKPVTGIEPTPINRLSDPRHHLGSEGWIVGFGQSGGNAGDYGLKRAGRVRTGSCSSLSGGELSNRSLVCWRYTSGPAGQSSNTCNGDSGGPLLVDFGRGLEVAGVTSGGTRASCGPGDVAFDANVHEYRGFIQARLAGDSLQACGAVPAVGRPATTALGVDGTLAKNQFHRYTFSTQGDPMRIRFALNGEDSGSFDVDFFAKRGGQASPQSWDCRSQGKAVFGACDLGSVAPGDWSVMVRSKKGQGDYQLTATAFRGGLSVSQDGPGGGSGGGGNGGGGGGGGQGASCAGACGDTPDGSCWCDQDCLDLGDCCWDFEPQCSQGSSGNSCTAAVCAEDPYCCAVDWDGLCEELADQLCG